MVAAVGGLLALLGVASTSEAAGAGRTIALSATFTDPGPAQNGMDGFRCLLRPGVVCEGRVHSRVTFVSGNMRGYTDYEGWMGPNADPARPLEFSTTYERFTGTVAGCGSPEHGPAVPGTFVYTARGYVGFDKLTADWSFVPGSGTGGLAGIISASGHEEGKPQHVEGSTDPTANGGSFTGTMTCSLPARAAPKRSASKCRRARRPRRHRPHRRSCRHRRAAGRHPH